MTHDSTPAQGEATGFSQGTFLGWLGLGLIGVMALFTLVVLSAAASLGFH